MPTITYHLETKMLDLISNWAWRVLVAFDRLVNAILLGDPDETISARMGKVLRKGQESDCAHCHYISNKICALLDMIDPEHCAKSAAHSDLHADDHNEGIGH